MGPCRKIVMADVDFSKIGTTGDTFTSVDRDERDQRDRAGAQSERLTLPDVTTSDGGPPGGSDGNWTVLRVYTEFGQFVYRTLQQLGIRLQDLDDLLHEVFVVVHVRLDSFDRSRSMKAWLYCICEHKVRNFRRSVRWRREVLVEDLPDASVDDENLPNPEDYVSLREDTHMQRRILTNLLDELDLRQRTILVMRHIDGRSYEEIAEVLEIPKGTVGSRLNVALKALKDAFIRREALLSKGGRK